MSCFKRLSLFFLLINFSLSAVADINTHFEKIRHSPNALYAFFKAMPKGGELHYHLTGGAYPEIMLKAASQGNYCFERDSWHIEKTTKHCDGVSSKTLIQNPELYKQVLRAWSMKDFNFYGAESSEDHFFSTFYKFYVLAEEHYPELLVDVMKRAAEQHEHYLEIMLLPAVPSLNKLPKEETALTVKNFAERRKQLLASPVFQSAVNETIQKIDDCLKTARKTLGCELKPQQNACQLTIKFQYFALREQPLKNVFEQALLGFLVAEKSKDVVGVNLVQAEDAFISLRDYKQQMQIFSFLHQLYPNVAIALHAGELNPQSVIPKDTRFHIHDAVYMAHANRIGHGVDIAHENNPEETMSFMKEHDIAVEINLTSNEVLLNIKGRQHPLNYYLEHQVPVVLSTDDEGLLRTDLTSQYVEAVLEHGLDYPTIKQINRNALTYSFLPGKSLWTDPSSFNRVSQCTDLTSNACLQFVKQNEKAQVQRQLEIELHQFESEFLVVV